MPIKTEWIVQDRVILSKLTGVLTIEEFDKWTKLQKEMVDKGKPFVHSISDSTQLEKLEIRLNNFQKLMTSFPNSPNLGWNIAVTNNAVTKMISSIVSQFAGIRNRNYSTLDEAIAFLKENDETLHDAVWNTVSDAQVDRVG